MTTGIPKYVQVLEKVNIEDDELKAHLQKALELGGVIVDKEMLKKNPNAKAKIMSIPVNDPKQLEGGNYEMVKQGGVIYWIYCGDFWYVRKNGDNHEFAQYLAYNTESKQCEAPWDKEYHEGQNKCSG